MSQMLVRTATETDVETIRDLTREAYRKWVSILGREPLPMTANYSYSLAKHRFDLIFIDTDLAAVIETVPDEGYLLIENVAVRPSYQRRGLGTQLINLAEEIACNSHFIGLRLYTNKRFVPNIAFYERLGFERQYECQINGDTLVYMTRLCSTDRSRHGRSVTLR